MFLTPILTIEVFDFWGIDIMGPLPSSCGYLHIHVTTDFVSKWIGAIVCKTNDQQTVVKFLI